MLYSWPLQVSENFLYLLMTSSMMTICADFGSDDCGYVTPHMKKAAPRIRSPTSNTSSTTNNQKKTSLKSDFGKPKAARSCQADFKRFSECRIEVAVPENPIEQMNQNLGDSDSEDSESCLNRNFEAKCFPFNRNSDERSRIGSSKFGARVVPLYGNADCDSTALDINATDVAGSQKEFENLSLIQKQLRQIENQQSSLLDLLQVLALSLCTHVCMWFHLSIFAYILKPYFCLC